MMPEERDLFCFTFENLFEQARQTPFERGYFRVRFYTQGGLLSRKPTEKIGDFYYYPSAGTIRDTEMNIVMYNARLDKYHVRQG
jgi:hypothetical protein